MFIFYMGLPHVHGNVGLGPVNTVSRVMKFGTINYRSDECGCPSYHTSKCALLVPFTYCQYWGLVLCDWGCGEALGKGLTARYQ